MSCEPIGASRWFPSSYPQAIMVPPASRSCKLRFRPSLFLRMKRLRRKADVEEWMRGRVMKVRDLFTGVEAQDPSRAFTMEEF